MAAILADLQAARDIAKAEYMKALSSAEYEQGSGGNKIRKRSQDIDKLYQAWMNLENEIDRLSGTTSNFTHIRYSGR